MKEIGLELKNIDPEDIDDILSKVETSFNIRFKTEDFAGMEYFGQLCEIISSKIMLKHEDSCTSQQAFYKLRAAIQSTSTVNSLMIAPSTVLSTVIPELHRRKAVKRIEKHLGFKLKILRPAQWMTNMLLLLLLSSMIYLFIHLQTGIVLFITAVAGLRITNYFGSTFTITTVADAVHKMARENYLQSRSAPGTFNQNEITEILRSWFSEALDLDKSTLTPDASFN